MNPYALAASGALLRRELIRFTRQPSRIVASIGTPLLLWAFLGAGFAESFAPPEGVGGGDDYAAFLLPGVAVAVVLFSAIFAAMSLIEDRRAGMLRTALVGPAPAWSIAAAKVAGGSVVATLQGVIVLLGAPLVGLTPGPIEALAGVAALLLIGISVTALGLAAAWVVNSSEGFHGVMNAALMPMWLLSGAFFPAEGASGWLAAIMLVNPLRWATDALRAGLTGAPPDAHVVLSWIVTLAFCAAGVGATILVFRRARPGA